MKKLLLIISTLIFYINLNSKAEVPMFNNLSSLKREANKYPEYPQIDNKNWLKPDYNSFYRKTTPSDIQIFIKKIKNIFGLKSNDWDSKQFKELLKKIIKKQNKYPKKKYILKISPQKTSNFVIWTGLEGAFHSLVRDLEELKKLKIIDESLKINQNNFFIFNGNLIGNSPYILETLTVVLKLIEKNPSKVFIIKGDYEIEDHWNNFGLNKELKIKLKNKLLKETPLSKEISEFLTTLPLAIYIKDQITNNPGFIRISYFNRNFKDLNETYFSQFLLNSPVKEIDIFNLKEKVLTKKVANIKTIIKGEKRIATYKKTDGLTAQLPDKGATSWRSLSSPIEANQVLYKFINDSFVILTIKKKETPIISLYKQNALNKKGFKKISYNTYSQNLLGKKEKIIKITKLDKEKISEKTFNVKEQLDIQKEIVVGTTMDLSAELSETARQVLKGLHLRIVNENKQGGVNGKKIKLIHLDDQYNQHIARENVKLLAKLGVDTLLCPVGSMILKAILPIIEKKNMLVMLPEATSPLFRKKELKNIVNFLASSGREGEVLINELIKKYTPSKIALFYQPEPFSLGALNAIKKILKKSNLVEKKDWIATYHLPNSLDVSNAAKKIKKFNPEAIMLLSTSLGVQNLIKELGMEFLFNKQILGISTCSGVAFKTFLRNKNLKYINTQLSPDPKTSNLEIVKEFRHAVNLAGEPLGGFILEGYMIADIFINIIKGINGKITKEKIQAASENIKNENYKGLYLNFNPETRSIFNSVWLDTGDEIKMIVN